MVIISASICDKQGKILVSRQYQNITKHNLEESVRNFPKMIQAQQQHTFVENEQARYIYLPLDTLYLLLTTKKNSNILEDQEALRLLYQIVQELCPSGLNEQNIINSAFEIILAFDDVISFGNREAIALSQVQNALEMESSEEKLHLMLMQARQNEAQEQIKKHQREFEKKRADKQKTGISNNSQSNLDFQSNSSSDVIQKQAQTLISEQIEASNAITQQQKPTHTPSQLAPKTGLQLGKKKPTQAEINSENTKNVKVQAEQKISEKKNQILLEEESKEQVFNPLKAPYEIEMIEKISASITKEGVLNQIDIVGELILTCLDANKKKAQIFIEHEHLNNLTFKLHPNMNRQAWQSNKCLSAKEQEEGFPINVKLPTLKMQYQTKDSQMVPFTISNWFTDGSLTMEIEYNSKQNKFNFSEKLTITIPVPQNEKPEVKNIENADFSLQSSQHCLQWLIPKLDAENPISNIEIQFSKQCKLDSIFPLNVSFSSPNTFVQLSIKQAINQQDSTPQTFKFTQQLITDKFIII